MVELQKRDECPDVEAVDRMQFVTSNSMSRIVWETENIWERRIFAILIKKIRENGGDYCLCQEITCSEIIKYCKEANKNIDETVQFKHLYRNIDEVVDRLLSPKIRTELDNEGSFRKTNLFTFIEYHPKKGDKGVIKVEFNRSLKSHILGLDSYFTQISLLEMLRLKNQNSQKMFQLLKSWDDRHEKVLSIEYLTDFLSCKPYIKNNFFYLNKRVLEPAALEINEKTELNFYFEGLNANKRSPRLREKIVYIKFVFVKNAVVVKDEIPQIEEVPAVVMNKEIDDLFLQIDSEEKIYTNQLSQGFDSYAVHLAKKADEEDNLRAKSISLLARNLADLAERGLKFTPITNGVASKLIVPIAKEILNIIDKQCEILDIQDIEKCLGQTMSAVIVDNCWPSNQSCYGEEFAAQVRKAVYRKKQEDDRLDHELLITEKCEEESAVVVEQLKIFEEFFELPKEDRNKSLIKWGYGDYVEKNIDSLPINVRSGIVLKYSVQLKNIQKNKENMANLCDELSL